MYKVLTVNGKDYKLEYTIEASLYDECIEKLVSFFEKAFGAMDADDEDESKRETAIRKSISGISNIPATTLSVFYAGLLEHHGTGRNGDKSVRSKEDAKDIIRSYFEEHDEDGTGNYYDLLMICVNQMGDDGFFKRIGLERMTSQAANPPSNQASGKTKTKASGQSS